MHPYLYFENPNGNIGFLIFSSHIETLSCDDANSTWNNCLMKLLDITVGFVCFRVMSSHTIIS